MSMRKGISVLLVLLMTVAGCLTAFADSPQMTDVNGTKYEAAVKALAEKGILTGYAEDQTFRPAKEITRAEACIVAVKAMGVSDADMAAAKDSGFTDLTGYGWAEQYINYAVSKGVVAGYGDGTFKPAANVTYNEMAAMLVNALGVKSSELTGTWPSNYVAKATELGMFKEIQPGGTPLDTGVAANRGDVALMTHAVADQIAEANKPEPDKDKEDPKDDEKDNSGGASSTGKLADYSGNATGMINGVARVINKDSESVHQLEFLMGNETMHLNTDGKCDISGLKYDGSVYTLKMQNGVVKDISLSGGRLKNFQELTSDFTEVLGRDARIITLAGAPSQLTVMRDAIFYEAVFSGGSIDHYKAVTLSSISKGSMIRAYDVTDDKTANADIVVIVKASDADEL